jgi:hypothetical protein
MAPVRLSCTTSLLSDNQPMVVAAAHATAFILMQLHDETPHSRFFAPTEIYCYAANP